jgi:hypothetical protein
MNLINNDYGSTKFCTLDSYKSDGKECESHWGGIISWAAIADLNQDGYFDVILNQSSGAPWSGLLPFSILVNCGNNTFIAIFGEEFTWINIKDAITSNQWLQLEAQYVALRQAGGNVGVSQDYILQFDEEKFSYKAIKSGNPK